MNISEKYILALLPLIEDLARLITIASGKEIFKEETTLILEFIMLTSICWNVADVTQKKQSVIAGVTKGSIMLLFGFVLVPLLLKPTLLLGKNRIQKLVIALTVISLCVLTEDTLWEVVENEI